LRGTRASQAGMVRCERKEEQARDLLRDGVLKGKGAKTSLQATCPFPGLWQRSAGYMGSPRNERLLIHVRRGSERSSTNDSPIEPIARIGRGSVPISKLTRNPSILLTSSLGSSCGPDPIRILFQSLDCFPNERLPNVCLKMRQLKNHSSRNNQRYFQYRSGIRSLNGFP